MLFISYEVSARRNIIITNFALADLV